MAEQQAQFDADEDPFTDSDEWLAAEVRQLFRAHRARDAKAVEVALFYFDHYLTLTLQRHLKQRDSEWEGPKRWFDGLRAQPELQSPGRLRLRGEVCWVSGQEHWFYDPFEFEMELCPKSGAFRGYVFRFGDHRPLAAKVSGSAASGVPVGGWVYKFERRRAEGQAVGRDIQQHPESSWAKMSE